MSFRSPIPLHIAIFDCDTPVPSVLASRGFYSDIFEVLLRDAAKTQLGARDLNLEFSRYDCVAGKLPSFENLGLVDGIVVTGSAASAYDQDPWVTSLVSFIRRIYISRPQIKLFGSCFGHQLIAHALFSPPSPSPAVVCQDPAGWELGLHSIAISPSFLSHFGPVTSNPSSPGELRMQFVHRDHVVLPALSQGQESLDGFESIGSSSHCMLQGIWKRGRVLTYQGHAEFDEFINRETIKVFGIKAKWESGFFGDAVRATEGVDDARWAAGVILRFFLENESIDLIEPARVRSEEIRPML